MMSAGFVNSNASEHHCDMNFVTGVNVNIKENIFLYIFFCRIFSVDLNRKNSRKLIKKSMVPHMGNIYYRGSFP